MLSNLYTALRFSIEMVQLPPCFSIQHHVLGLCVSLPPFLHALPHRRTHTHTHRIIVESLEEHTAGLSSFPVATPLDSLWWFFIEESQQVHL